MTDDHGMNTNTETLGATTMRCFDCSRQVTQAEHDQIVAEMDTIDEETWEYVEWVDCKGAADEFDTDGVVVLCATCWKVGIVIAQQARDIASVQEMRAAGKSMFEIAMATGRSKEWIRSH